MLGVFFRNSRKTLMLMFLSMPLLFNACGGTNEDPVTEISCSAADGLWTVVSATCNGVTQENVAPVTFLFDTDNSTMTQTIGRVDCATTRNWSIEVGSETAIFSMTGTGPVTCTESSLQTSACASDVNTCNAGVDFSGIRNEFPTCVISQNGMSLVRTVSSINNPDGLSYCTNGESEVVQLIQGEYTAPPVNDPDSDLAFLEIDGPNPVDFGTHPVSARVNLTLTMTNIGNGPAGSINAAGLAAPYTFLGGSFPGTGGTCDADLEVGENCTMVLEFFPSTAGYFTDNLIISYNNGGSTVSINQGIAGTASATLGELVISDGPVHNYLATLVGNTDPHTFTITNVGGGDASSIADAGTLATPFQYVGGTFPGTGGTCTATLTAGSNCSIVVEFAPASDGTFNDVIEINYLDGVNNQQVRRNVFGEGLP